MAVGGHHQGATVGVPKLHRYISVRYTQFEQVRGAEVTQLIEVHRWATKSRAHKTPIVQMAALRETAPARRHEKAGHVEALRDIDQCLTGKRRKDDSPRQPILGGLDLPSSVEVLPDDNLVLAYVAALQRVKLTRSQANVGRERDHRSKGRTKRPQTIERTVSQAGDLRLR